MIRYSYKKENGKEYYIDNIGLFIDKDIRQNKLKELFESSINKLNIDLKTKKINPKIILKELKSFLLLSNNFYSILEIESSTNYYLYIYDLVDQDEKTKIKSLVIDPNTFSFYFIDQVDSNNYNIKKYFVSGKKMIYKEYRGLKSFDYESELEMNNTINKIKELS